MVITLSYRLEFWVKVRFKPNLVLLGTQRIATSGTNRLTLPFSAPRPRIRKYVLGLRNLDDDSEFDPIRSEKIFEEHRYDERGTPQNNAETDHDERLSIRKRGHRPGSGYSSGNSTMFP